MVKWKVFLISAALLAAAGAGSTWFWSRSTSNELLQVATPPQIFEQISQMKSPLILVNFWATWCEPCKQEFPSIMTLRERFAPRGLKVVFISIDEAGEREAAEQFLREQNVDFPTFFRGEQSLKFVNEIYPPWSGAIPMSLLMGSDLKVLDAWEGDTSLEEFETRVKRHLKGS